MTLDEPRECSNSIFASLTLFWFKIPTTVSAFQVLVFSFLHLSTYAAILISVQDVCKNAKRVAAYSVVDIKSSNWVNIHLVFFFSFHFPPRQYDFARACIPLRYGFYNFYFCTKERLFSVFHYSTCSIACSACTNTCSANKWQ